MSFIRDCWAVLAHFELRKLRSEILAGTGDSIFVYVGVLRPPTTRGSCAFSGTAASIRSERITRWETPDSEFTVIKREIISAIKNREKLSDFIKILKNRNTKESLRQFQKIKQKLDLLINSCFSCFFAMFLRVFEKNLKEPKNYAESLRVK